jgi:hypothetical protein
VSGPPEAVLGYEGVYRYWHIASVRFRDRYCPLLPVHDPRWFIVLGDGAQRPRGTQFRKCDVRLGREGGAVRRSTTAECAQPLARRLSVFVRPRFRIGGPCIEVHDEPNTERSASSLRQSGSARKPPSVAEAIRRSHGRRHFRPSQRRFRKRLLPGMPGMPSLTLVISMKMVSSPTSEDNSSLSVRRSLTGMTLSLRGSFTAARSSRTLFLSGSSDLMCVVEVLTSVTGFQRLSPGTGTDAKGRLRTHLLRVLVRTKANGRSLPITTPM